MAKYNSSVSVRLKQTGLVQRLMSDSKDISLFRREQDSLWKAIEQISSHYELLNEVLKSSEGEGEYVSPYDAIDTGNFELS